MSSPFTAAEIDLARLGWRTLSRAGLDVVVGGLGLGYTARAGWDISSSSPLIVVEALDEVIDWHEPGCSRSASH